MVSRVIVAAVVICGGTVAAAQTLVTIQVPADAQYQISVFEDNLRKAIERAGQQMADRARQAAPGIPLELQFEADIWVKGALMPGGEGAVFMVGVPGIEPSALSLLDVIARRLAQQPPTTLPRVSGTASPPASGSAAPGVVETPAPVPMADPEKEYSDFTYKALVDAMLDNAFALPLREGQTLTLVVGSVVTGTMLNPLAKPERMLYLRIKAGDLAALRQNRITREEAIRRIMEWRY